MERRFDRAEPKLAERVVSLVGLGCRRERRAAVGRRAAPRMLAVLLARARAQARRQSGRQRRA